MATVGDEFDRRIRLEAFRFLEQSTMRHGEILRWSTLVNDFIVDGIRVPLLGASGIWKPALMDRPISITTSPPRGSTPAPYDDDVRDDGLLAYRYRGTSANEPDNVRLRAAFRERRPLIYFHGVQRGLYRPFWPVVIEEDHPAQLHVAVAIHDSVNSSDLGDSFGGDSPLERSYARRLTLQRLHQAAFRERVLRAYRHACTVCNLQHVELLDAAHILLDSDPRSQPVVDNGMALCKIHHAAFDRHILGIRPDFVVEIREDILHEVDGPMLRYGLQEAHGQMILLPRRPELRPNTDFLEERYQQFRQAG